MILNRILHIKSLVHYTVIILLVLINFSCKNETKKENNTSKSKEVTAKDILGNQDYQAISYGGYRTNTRNNEPTISEIKEDLKILSALKIKVIRTYNVHLEEAENILKAITELKKESRSDGTTFEMYVMLGAWIDCKNAFTNSEPNHFEESERNPVEITEVVRLANLYPEIVKIIAVGNEAMVKWATNYYVQPSVILKWVTHLQELKKNNKLSKDLWITCSDNFASWGGGDAEYHVEDLNKLIKAVDYVSMHTYPMHDTHYNPVFWGIKDSEQSLSDKEKIDATMVRARDYAISQYKSVVKYVHAIDKTKAIHIGETGWATSCNELFSEHGSKAADEYKSAQYYKLMREWSTKEKISCFYFQAFDENWKDSGNPGGSENHFGLINLQNQVKYALWNDFDNEVFKGLTRNGKPLTKSYNGNEKELWKDVKFPKPLH